LPSLEQQPCHRREPSIGSGGKCLTRRAGGKLEGHSSAPGGLRRGTGGASSTV